MFKLTRPYNWLIFSLINPELEKMLKQYATGRMIDIGCGVKPYQAMASPYVREHIGLDHEDTIHDKSHIDYFGDAYHIPFDDNFFDSALCTDVLEHLEEPHLAIAETWRVLKPGGYAIYTVPLFWHLHEQPRDFYRYTKFGLNYLFQKNSFEVIEIKALSGFLAMLAQESVYFLWRFRHEGGVNPLRWLIPPLGMVIQRAAYLLNKIDKSEDFTMEYIAVVRKPLHL